MHLQNENIWDLAGLQVQATVMAIYGIIFLSKELTDNCFSRLKSINEYLFIDWDGHDRWLGSDIMQRMGTCGPWCPVLELCHCQCTWITPAKLQVECSNHLKSPHTVEAGKLSPHLT